MDTKKLRQKILDLAIHGKLVPQDPNDEPASVLLERIREEKDRLIKEGKIKKTKSTASSDTSHYENVPFGVPEGWCWCRLDCVGEIVTGSTPSKDNVDYYGGTVPFYKPTDLEQGINTIEASDSLTELGFSVSRQLPSQSILVTCIGATIGKTGLIQKRGTCNQQINAIISNDMVLPEYLYYTCISGYMQSEIIGRASATTLPILNKNKFSEIPIPVPPIQEQHRIISKIETFFSFVIELENSDKELIGTILTAKSKILDLAIHGKLVPQDTSDEPASELLKRINPKAVASCDNPHYENVPFEIPVNWVWVKVCDIAQSNIGLTYKPSDISQDGVPVMRSNNIQNGVLCNDDIVRVNTKLLDSQVLNNGDLLICARNGSKNLVGKCALVNNIQETTSFGAFMAVCRSNMNNWLYHVLSSEYFKNYLDDSNSTTIHQVTQKMLLAFDIPLPPLREQKRICSKIKELYNTIDDITDALS